MYDCPNCAANLRFDIETQKLKCDHCNTLIDPYDYHKERDAEEREDFGVTVFHCPQCGAEVMSTDVSATGFCNYCGASTIFDTRIADEKRPDYIIPFRTTKEACRDAYGKLLKKAPYAPADMRDPAFLDRITGIYIPYWVYEFEIKNEPELNASAKSRDGDYIVEGAYRMTGSLDGKYVLSYDASSFFHDRLAYLIAPYPAKERMPFVPSFLSGFYADTSDVDAKIYLQDAKNHVGAHAYERFVNHSHFDDVSPGVPATASAMDKLFALDEGKAKRGLFPVWFLTWRNKDRVAYAVMNGLTGKLSADIPIDAGRFLAGSLLTAIPLFALFQYLMTLTAPGALIITMFFAIAFGLAYNLIFKKNAGRSVKTADPGIAARQHLMSGGKPEYAPVKSDYEMPRQSFDMRMRGDKLFGGKVISALLAVFGVFFSIMELFEQNGRAPRISRPTTSAVTSMTEKMEFAGIVGIILCLVLAGLLIRQVFHDGRFSLFLNACPLFASTLYAGYVLMTFPVSDLPFYLAGALVLAGGAIAFTGLIRMYNRIVTSPVPHLFEREGGTDR